MPKKAVRTKKAAVTNEELLAAIHAFSQSIEKTVVTKEEFYRENAATKQDIRAMEEKMVTKEEFHTFIDTAFKTFATKDELNELKATVQRMDGTIQTISVTMDKVLKNTQDVKQEQMAQLGYYDRLHKALEEHIRLFTDEEVKTTSKGIIEKHKALLNSLAKK